MCVFIGSLRGTIIAGNPLHGRLICFHRGHSIPAPPPPPPSPLAPPHLPFLFLFTTPQWGSSFSPYLIPQRSLLHGSFVFSVFLFLLPSPPSLAALFPLEPLILLHRESKRSCSPSENQTNDEIFGIFLLSLYPPHIASPATPLRHLMIIEQGGQQQLIPGKYLYVPLFRGSEDRR